MAHLRSRQVMFISMLFGGRVYTGKDIHNAHELTRSHGLTQEHFDMFIQHFRAALLEEGVKPEHVEMFLKLLERKRSAVVEP